MAEQMVVSWVEKKVDEKVVSLAEKKAEMTVA